jgi:GH18 family chitinase
LVALALFVTSVFYGLEQLRITSQNDRLGIIGDRMGKRAILYHTNWANYGRNFQVKDIPIKGVTDIAYAFFNMKDNGGGNWVITSGDTYVSPRD